jgi:prophage antirepressor-like protein
MSTDIIPFCFEAQSVRVVSNNGDPWFVAKDVCEILGYKNPRQVLSTHLDEDEKGVQILDTLGGNQELVVISESGLYALIFKSRKPEAKKFRKWVTSEVLPAIRRTGSYAVPAGVVRIQHLLEMAMVDVYEGRMPLPKAHALSVLASQYLKAQAVNSLTDQ